MRNLKKILALVLSLMMVLSVMVTASATDFADDADITNKEAVEVMSALGILSGSQGKFAPQGTLERAQAAKIIAFIKLGADADALLKGTGTKQFSDVTSGWAFDYISYCAGEGIVSGSQGKFFPKNTLTGYEFGKMVLNAAGVEGTYTGSQWKINVATALKKAKLLEGLDDLVLSANITREQASQLAFNAMNYTAATTAVTYVVFNDVNTNGTLDDGEVVLYRGTDAMTAVALSNAGYALILDTTKAGSLGDTVFGLSSKETKDAFGRSTKTYTSTMVKDMKVVLSDATPAYSYTAASKETVTNTDSLITALNKQLKLTGDDVLKKASPTAIVDQYVNGVKDDGAVTPTNTYSNIGVGDQVEVYATKGVVSKVVVIKEKIGKAAVAPKAETSGTNKGLFKWTFGTAVTYAAKDAYTKDAYYLVVENETTNAALSVKAPAVISSAKITGADNSTLTSANYYIVNGAKLVKGGAYNEAVTGSVAVLTAYDYLLDSAGNVLLVADPATAPVEDPLESGYAYLLAAEKQVLTNSSSIIGGDYAWEIVAKAQLATVAGTKVVDLTVKTTVNSATGKVTAVKINGTDSTITADAAPVDLTNTGAMFNGYTWVKYTVQKDGTYTLAKVDTSKTVALAKGSAAVDGKVATSATTWALYDYTSATKTVTVTEVKGIANFVTGTYVSEYVANTAGVITAISSFKSTTPAAADTTYAYYVGQGDYDAEAASYTQRFYIDGKTVEYFIAATGSVSFSAGDKGKVYVLTIDTDGKISAAANKTYDGTDKEVTLLDETFAVLGTDTLYFAKNCKVFNVSDGHEGEADTLTAKTASSTGDKVSYIKVGGAGADKDQIAVIYITTEAN